MQSALTLLKRSLDRIGLMKNKGSLQAVDQELVGRLYACLNEGARSYSSGDHARQLADQLRAIADSLVSQSVSQEPRDQRDLKGK
jgi:hypothetical protein